MGFTVTVTWLVLMTVMILFYTGFGVTRLLSFQRIVRGEFLIAPMVGFSLIITVAYWCGWFGGSARAVVAAVLLLSTLFNLLALIRRRRMPGKVREQLPIFALACLGMVVALYPLWQSGTLAPIGRNGDQVWHSNVSAYLERNSFPTPPPSLWKPAMVQLSFSDDLDLTFGFSYLHAFIDTISGHEAHETFSIVTAVGRVLSVLVYAFLATYLFGTSSLGSMFVALLTAASPMLMWLHYNDYAPHAMSLGLVPLAFGVAMLTLEEGTRYVLLPSLLLSAAFATYPSAASAFALAPSVLYVALRGVQKRHQLASSLRTLATLYALVAVLNLPGILHAGKTLTNLLDLGWIKQFGDIDGYVSWVEIYGLAHHRLPEQMPLFTFAPAFSPLLAFGALSLTLYGASRTQGAGRTAFLSLVICYVLFVFWVRFILNFPYGFFKALTFVTFPAFAGLVLGFEGLVLAGKDRPGWRKMAIVSVFGVLLAATNIANLIGLSRSVVASALDFPSLLALRNVKGLLQGTERIHIRDAQDTPLLWMTYFLKDYDLSLAHYTPYFLRWDWPFYQEAISADLVLVNKDTPGGEPWAIETVYENTRYKLLRKDPKILAYVDSQRNGRRLKHGDTVRIEVLTDHLVIDNRSIALGRTMQSGDSLRMGLLAPAGSALRLNSPNQEEMLRLARNIETLQWPIAHFPSEIKVRNDSERTLFMSGWVEVMDGTVEPDSPVARGDIFTWFPEDVIPGSGFYLVSGWYTLEEDKRRWSRDASFSIFRNPSKPVALTVAGFLSRPPGDGLPQKASIFLNGYLLGELDKPGDFRETYFVPEEILGSSAWGSLEIDVNKTFNPKALGISEDSRDLGLFMTHLALLDLELPADGFIDIGTTRARRYFGRGWSGDEQEDEVTFVWADANESELWLSFAPATTLKVDVRVLPFQYPASPPQRLTIYVNGTHLQELALEPGGWQMHSFRLPQSFLSPGLNNVRFVYSHSVPPAQVLPDSHDARALAVAFDFIMFRPE